MTYFIVTLGFDLSAIMKLIVREQIKDGDTLILIRPAFERDERGKEAVNSLRKLVTKLGKINLESFEVVSGKLIESTTNIVKIIKETEEKKVLGAIGGDREVMIAVLTAALAIPEQIDCFYGFSDMDRVLRKHFLPNFYCGVDEKDILILKNTNTEKSLSELSKILKTSISTVSRHCQKLLDKNALEERQEKKEKVFKVTNIGKLFLAIHD